VRQTYYLHNGALFDRRQHRNAMFDLQGLSSISHDAPIDEHAATALPVRDKLASAELLFQMSQNPVVTQESQNGKSFHKGLWQL
jgi:hypothetical protein